jgi:hypothetical protein
MLAGLTVQTRLQIMGKMTLRNDVCPNYHVKTNVNHDNINIQSYSAYFSQYVSQLVTGVHCDLQNLTIFTDDYLSCDTQMCATCFGMSTDNNLHMSFESCIDTMSQVDQHINKVIRASSSAMIN